MDFLQNIHVFSLSQSLPRQGLRPWWGVRVMQIAFAFTAEEAKSDCNFRWMTGIGPGHQRLLTNLVPHCSIAA